MNAPSRVASVLFLLGALFTPARTGAQKPAPVSDPVLEREFAQIVRPFVNEYCTDCHSGAQPEAQLDLTSFATLSSVLDDLPHWTLLMERLNHQEMPPDSNPNRRPISASR